MQEKSSFLSKVTPNTNLIKPRTYYDYLYCISAYTYIKNVSPICQAQCHHSISANKHSQYAKYRDIHTMLCFVILDKCRTKPVKQRQHSTIYVISRFFESSKLLQLGLL